MHRRVRRPRRGRWPALRHEWCRDLAAVADRRDLRRRLGALIKENAEPVVVQDRGLHLDGLVVLATGVGTHDDETGLFRHRAGDLAAALLDRGDRLLAAGR